jgi:hypothetical protein
MKTEKLSLSNIKNKLSRAEMKKIMAGSGGGGGGGGCVPLDDPCCYPGPGQNGCPQNAPICCSGLSCWPDGPTNSGLCQ